VIQWPIDIKTEVVMKKIFLILPLATLLFATQGWAPPPGKGGATGDQDISKCNLKPKEQTKIKLKDKSGKTHHICTGQAVCGGETVPINCRVSERESCPVAKKCISLPDEFASSLRIEDGYFRSKCYTARITFKSSSPVF